MSNCPEISFPVRSTNTKLDLGLQMKEIAVETFPFSLFPRNPSWRTFDQQRCVASITRCPS